MGGSGRRGGERKGLKPCMSGGDPWRGVAHHLPRHAAGDAALDGQAQVPVAVVGRHLRDLRDLRVLRLARARAQDVVVAIGGDVG